MWWAIFGPLYSNASSECPFRSFRNVLKLRKTIFSINLVYVSTKNSPYLIRNYKAFFTFNPKIYFTLIQVGLKGLSVFQCYFRRLQFSLVSNVVLNVCEGFNSMRWFSRRKCFTKKDIIRCLYFITFFKKRQSSLTAKFCSEQIGANLFKF